MSPVVGTVAASAAASTSGVASHQRTPRSPAGSGPPPGRVSIEPLASARGEVLPTFCTLPKFIISVWQWTKSPLDYPPEAPCSLSPRRLGELDNSAPTILRRIFFGRFPDAPTSLYRGLEWSARRPGAVGQCAGPVLPGRLQA